jgi:ectoine hydroxylase-related dioxygenase (phytanoyl-CoA dioxygenase family)
MMISDREIEHYLEHGYVVVEPFLSAAELAEARRALPGVRVGTRGAPISDGHLFPFDESIFNRLTTHPDLLAFGRRLIGADSLATYGALIWNKRDNTPSDEQLLHLDYPNNTLTYPRDDGLFRHVLGILYLTDVEADLGPTHVVSRRHNGRGSFLDPMATRERRPDLYAVEQRITCPAGTLFLYGMTTFHRGSAITRPGGRRSSLHLHVFAAANRWMGTHHALLASTPEMTRFLVEATPEQRHAIGWPEPGHPYWNAEMLAAVARRYPELDLSPYQPG